VLIGLNVLALSHGALNALVQDAMLCVMVEVWCLLQICTKVHRHVY
jgi:hypothetical protein